MAKEKTEKIFRYSPPGDKSISQRALIACSLARGTSTIKNLSSCEDSLFCLKAIKKAGAKVYSAAGDKIYIKGGFPRRYKKTLNLSCGESATAMRLLAAALCGSGIGKIKLKASGTLRKRSMSDLIEILKQLGAKIKSDRHGRPPLTIENSCLKAARVKSEKISAQLKSAALFAALSAQGETSFEEKFPTRDHTERLLKFMGAFLKRKKNKIIIRGCRLKKAKITIPGDFSCAAFLIAAAVLTPNAAIKAEKVGLNPLRTGFLKALKKMKARIKVVKQKNHFGFEPQGNILAFYSPRLKGAKFSKNELFTMIDEIPILAVIACAASGTTKIPLYDSLKNKESDRIKAIIFLLKKIGADFSFSRNYFTIKGDRPLKGGLSSSFFSDHRIIMAAEVASLICERPIITKNKKAVKKSYPDFFGDFKKFKQLNGL
ncbi:MAG: 3-phosphoshikimate 1-carboxyvinyltransferase [Elusimicrobiota bacterium]